MSALHYAGRPSIVETLVRQIAGDLNEAGSVCGGCAVYVISIAWGGRMWTPTVFFDRLCGAPMRQLW